MKNRLVLIALFAIFLLPILVAVALNSRWIDWQAAPDRAHGDLLQPVVPLGPFQQPDIEGTLRSNTDLADRWQLVWLTPESCGSDCLPMLEMMHNIRLAQDRRAGEVGMIVLHAGQFDPTIAAAATRLDTNFMLFDGAPAESLRARFPQPQAGTFYIVDPAGNIMERFDSSADLTGIRKDLDRLLTWTLSE